MRRTHERPGTCEQVGKYWTSLLARELAETVERNIADGMTSQPDIEHRARGRFRRGAAQIRVAEQAAAGRGIRIDGEYLQQIERGPDDRAFGERRCVGDLEDTRLGQRTTDIARGRQQDPLKRATHFRTSRSEIRHDDGETRRWPAVQNFGEI